jgi:hypothetical protein
MIFRELLSRAKAGNVAAVNSIMLMYRPLLTKEAVIGGIFDEDLYQEFCLTILRCIRRFQI